MTWTTGSGGNFVKRLSQPIEFRRDLTLYGSSNLYPQMVAEVMFRSPITLSAVHALADFTAGVGFQFNGDLIVNRHEQSINDILKIVSAAYSTYNGFALHFNVNEVGAITEITVVDFDYVRFGLPDSQGIHNDVKINPNWEKDSNKTLANIEIVETYPLWLRRNEMITDEVEDFGGYIHYFTGVPDQYPKATFDSVLDSAQVNGDIQVFELGNIQNGFQSASFYLHRGKIESDKERQQILANLRSMKGPENANSVQLFEVPIDFDSNILETVPANNNDRLFELTNDNSVERIVASFGMPFPILGLQPDGGIFNQDQINDAYTYYNLRTKNRRSTLADQFNRFMAEWWSGGVDVGEIIENEFEPVSDAGGAEDNDTPQDVNADAQAGLRGSVGGVQGILSIQESVGLGTTSRESATTMLIEIYGFDEETANKLLGEVKQDEDGGDSDN